ncbi:MAG: ABC transporter permease [Chloroflexi bacterium]|nr:ABC transporter permease [Chloroflexota bacterium]
MRHRIRELVTYHDLIHNLVVRDLKVRYKHSALGILWSLMNPLLMMLVFTVVFTVMMPNNEIKRFPLFILCALLPWNFFSGAIMGGLSSIVNNGHLIKKVYFSREVLPLSVVLSNLVNFLLSLLIVPIFMLIYHTLPTIWLIWLPVVILIQVIFTLGLVLFLSTVDVYYRDTAMIMEVLMLAWFFMTPIFYPLSILPHYKVVLGLTLDIRRLTYIINPMASIIASYRVIIYSGAPPALDFIARTAVTSLVVLLGGYAVFNRFSPYFGEEV